MKNWEIGPFIKYEGNPVLSPSESGFDSWTTYNSAVCVKNGKFYMFYRAEDRADLETDYCGTSRIGLAISDDGYNFERYDDNPVIDADEPHELPGGVEDPRIVKFGDEWHMFYTAYNHPENVFICRAISKDLINWTKTGPIFKKEFEAKISNKSCAIVCNPQGEPVMINGKYHMYTNEFYAVSDNFYDWETVQRFAASKFSGPGEVCVAVTDYKEPGRDNILLVIAGSLRNIYADKNYFYAASQALYDRNDPMNLLDHADDACVFAEHPYEKSTDRLEGDAPARGTIFICSLFAHDNKWWMYYGASDKYTALTTANV